MNRESDDLCQGRKWCDSPSSHHRAMANTLPTQLLKLNFEIDDYCVLNDQAMGEELWRSVTKFVMAVRNKFQKVSCSVSRNCVM